MTGESLRALRASPISRGAISSEPGAGMATPKFIAPRESTTFATRSALEVQLQTVQLVDLVA